MIGINLHYKFSLNLNSKIANDGFFFNYTILFNNRSIFLETNVLYSFLSIEIDDDTSFKN